ncbi:ATP-binding protein [Marinilactibacillus psychrotolerans]|uniref:ATP-binding protein n=1 Tax=Marinilactibacillus psychrotolerans TaxID=191770 RepID=UPI00388E8EA1
MNKILLLIGVIGIVFCLERKYYWTLIVTFTTLTFFTIYNLYTNSEIIPFLNHSINNSHWLVILVLSFCLLIFLAHFLSLLKEFEKTRKINKVIQKQLDFYGKYSSNYVKQKEYEKMLLHDFKQHMIYLREVGKEYNSSQLREYIASISSDFFSRKERFNEISGNLVVDIILNHYKNLAEEAKIKLNIEAEIPKDIEYDPSDISVLLGNLLENSYEANLKDDITEKFIDVKIKYKKSVLFIWIQNSFDGKILKVNNGKFLTNKQDKDWHGIGIESIKEIVKKYNGECQFQTKYNRFQVKIFM